MADAENQWKNLPNSITEAMIMACFIVNDREETDVAKEFATSLAPIFHASRKAKIIANAKTVQMLAYLSPVAV